MGYSFRNIVKLFYNTGDSFQTSRHFGPVGNHHSAPRRVTEEHLYQEHVDVCWRVKCAAVWYSGDAAGPSCSAAAEQGGFNPGCLRRSLFKYETPVTVHADTSLLITSEGFLQKMRLSSSSSGFRSTPICFSSHFLAPSHSWTHSCHVFHFAPFLRSPCLSVCFLSRLFVFCSSVLSSSSPPASPSLH